MKFTELLAKLGATTAKTLNEARELLTEATAGLAAAVEQIATLTSQASASEQARSALESQLTMANGKITELTTELASVQTGVIAQLAAVGIKVEKLEPEPLKAALAARIESEAQVLLAARGIKPLPEQIKPSGEIDAALSTDAAILAQYESMPPGEERVAFLTKHEAAIWRAHGAR